METYFDRKIYNKMLNNNDSIKISIADKNNIMIQVESTLEFSKKYLKYLTKKYLKKEGIEKYMTINANSPNGYAVKIIKKNNEV